MTQALAEIETEAIAVQTGALPDPRVFEQDIDRAASIAKILARIIEQGKLFTKIGDSRHIHIEAWKTIGEPCGYSVSSEETGYDEHGFKAKAWVIRKSDGMIVSQATSRCGGEGDSNWPSKPSHQQGSMAQTRAASKALKNVLDWIVVMAGYSSTPAEEMQPRQASPQQDQNLMCPSHGVEWRKTSRGNYAHAIEGTEPTKWCNKPSTPPRQKAAPPAQKQPVAPSSDGQGSKPQADPTEALDLVDDITIPELQNRVVGAGKTIQDVYEVLGMSASEFKAGGGSFLDAWVKCLEAWDTSDA